MSEAISIKKRNKKDSETSFERLRHTAIEHIQALSGKLWTDFNAHDPGITILEQLIYAITELDYRAEFSIENLLADKNNDIDYTLRALYSPVEIYPCRPVTILDYRKIFLNEIHDIDNLWLVPTNVHTNSDPKRGSPVANFHGLYDISVKLPLDVTQSIRQNVINEIKNIYCRSRNLCEDIASVSIVDNVAYVLCAEIEVLDTHNPVDILAEIYFSCSQHIAGNISVRKFDDPDFSNQSLDELLNGPYSPNGFYSDSDFEPNQQEFLISTLFSVINSISGVNYIGRLSLKKDGETFYHSISLDSSAEAFDLAIPKSADEIEIILSKNGRILGVEIDEVQVKLDELNFLARSSRSTAQEISALTDLPIVNYVPLDEYWSIQNQFPITYGINAFGVPESASKMEKAKARQLKSYLILFEQFLMNFLANLDSMKELYSLNHSQKRSYFYKLLEKDDIGDFDAVYPKNAGEKIAGILAKFDNYHDRKNRVIDYLLAIYGETIPSQTLRQFSFYSDGPGIEDAIIKNKITYLKFIVEIARDRAAGVNYAVTDWQQCAKTGLQLRVNLLLGFELQTARSLTMAVLKLGFKLTRHCEYEHLNMESMALKFIETDHVDKYFDEIPTLPIDDDPSMQEIRQAIGENSPLNHAVLSDALLIDGIYINRYKVGSLTSNRDFQLTFQIAKSQHWYIGTYSDKKSAIIAANYLRYFLVKMSKESEGFHVLEHILLRPVGSASFSSISFLPNQDYFSLKASIFLPNWTARCNNPQFQLLAEETLDINMPAHIEPTYFWLDFQKMYEFETLYENWMERKSNSQTGNEELNSSAEELICFMLENQFIERDEENS